jgi:hypothetical protein
MMKTDDLEYFRRRLAEELAEAERTARPDVRHVHQKLAELYRGRIAELSGGSRQSTPRLEVGAIQAVIERA